MIDDPRSPGCRYPDVGDRLWHRASRRWLTVAGPPADRTADSVLVTFDPSSDSTTAKVDALLATVLGDPRLVHLRFLYDVDRDVRTCRHCGCPIKNMPEFGDGMWYHSDRPFTGSGACCPAADPETITFAEPVGYVPIEQRLLPRRISRLLERP